MSTLVMNEYGSSGRYAMQVTGPAEFIHGSARSAIRAGRNVTVFQLQDTHDNGGALGIRMVNPDATPVDLSRCDTCINGCGCEGGVPGGAPGCEHFGCWGYDASNSCHGVADARRYYRLPLV